MKNMLKNHGFTLIEILIVVVIIGILATIIFANFSIVKRSRDAQRKSDLHKIQAALEQYAADNGTYPFNIYNVPYPGVSSLKSPDGNKTYMEKVPRDPSNYLDDFYINAWNWPPEYYYTLLTSSTYLLKACVESPNSSDSNIQSSFGPGNPSDNGFDPNNCKGNKMYKLINP